MLWKTPSITKIYEALGTIADGRLEISGNAGKVYSSSGYKYYDIAYDPDKNAIMSNDNSSYWTGALGYPAIAFLMKKGIFSYDQKLADLLKGVAWKDVNQKFKNDFEKALEFIISTKTEEERKSLADFADKVYQEIKDQKLSLLGKRAVPPSGY